MDRYFGYILTASLASLLLVFVAAYKGREVTTIKQCNDAGKVMVKINDAFNCVNPEVLKNLK